MIHLESLICYACQTKHTRNLFDNDKRKAIYGTCGHSICLLCVQSEPDRNCPICRRIGAFKNETVNYSAMKLMEECKINAFDVFRKWWETVETGIGVCFKCSDRKPLRICLTCQNDRNFKDVNLGKYALCEKCADESIERTNGSAYIHQCDKIGFIDRLQGVENIECTKCGTETNNPQLCTLCFQIHTNHINVDTSSFCAYCILEDHSDHKTSKACEDYSIRNSTVTIVAKLLEIKLEVPDDKMKCKLRHYRILDTFKRTIYWASNLYPHYTKDDCEDPKLIGRPKIPEGRVEGLLTSLEKQYDQLQKLESVCHCVEVWKDVVRLNIFDCHGAPPHIQSMIDKTNVEDEMDGCPFDFESSKPEKESLLRIIERGERLTEPLEEAWKTCRNQKMQID